MVRKQAVISVDAPLYSPAGMVSSDADIILAIHHLISNAEWTPDSSYLRSPGYEGSPQEGEATEQGNGTR